MTSSSQNSNGAFKTLRDLHRITADHKLSLDEKIDQLIALGCETFDLPLALVSRIKGQSYVVKYAKTPGGEVKPGDAFELGNTYCFHTLNADSPIAYSEAGKSDISQHPCYQNFGLESYIGAPLIVNDARYGTLNFSGPEPHPQPFTDDDLELVRLFSQWVGNELTRSDTLSEMNQQQRLLESMSELARIGSWRVDLKNEEISWSKVTCEIHEVSTDYKPDLQTAINFYKPGKSREEIQELVRKGMETGKAWNTELQIITAKGKEVWVAAMGQPELENGKVVGLLGTVQDIDERVRSNLMLKREKEKAESAVKAKSAFLANMSNEIRTPMNGVIGILGVLGRGQLSEEQYSQLSMAQSSANDLLRLLNDILDFSKIEAEQMNIEASDFEIREFFENVLVFMQTLALEKGLAFNWDLEDVPETWLNGDSGRIRQVLVNLVGNAIKFTEHGEISVIARLEDKTIAGQRLFVEVRDTGIGIASENISRLFDAFTQDDVSATRRFGVTGLGLAIVRQLCELMGGEVRATSVLGKGSCFSFNILLSEGNSPEGDETVQEPSDIVLDPARFNILLVEDNVVNQLVAQHLLEAEGLTSDIAENGKRAIEALVNSDHQKPYTVVLMDCQMPEMDGYEATRLIRAGEAGPQYKAVPIVALTANAMQGDRQKCADAGMTGYLSKPLNLDDLKACLLALQA